MDSRRLAREAIQKEFKTWSQALDGQVTLEHVFQFQSHLFKEKIALYNSIQFADRFTALKEMVAEVAELKSA
jgi:hypothetical protein